jgi:hypothetical protein
MNAVLILDKIVSKLKNFRNHLQNRPGPIKWRSVMQVVQKLETTIKHLAKDDTPKLESCIGSLTKSRRSRRRSEAHRFRTLRFPSSKHPMAETLFFAGNQQREAEV